MSDANASSESFLPLRHVAVRLGVPMAWLSAEAEAKRIPHILAGRRVLANQHAVERSLLDRAAASVQREEPAHA